LTPFNPRDAIYKFCGLLRTYHVSSVWGDAFGGATFPSDFSSQRIAYRSPVPPKTEQYEAFEPILNAGEIELPDHNKMQEQLLTLVVRGSHIDCERGASDDFSNAVAGLVWLARSAAVPMKIPASVLARLRTMSKYRRPIGDDKISHGESVFGARRYQQMMATADRRRYGL
jgi:hypothetical protein